MKQRILKAIAAAAEALSVAVEDDGKVDAQEALHIFVQALTALKG